MIENENIDTKSIILKCSKCHRLVGYLHIEDLQLINTEVMRYFNDNKIYFACPKCIVRKRFDVYN